MIKLSFCALVAAAMLIDSQAALAGWPEDRSIEVMVGYAPGGSTDLMARAILPFVRKHLGDKTPPPVVINRPGASGEISTAQIERAKPDGYLVGLVAGVAVSATCAILPPYLVRKRVERLAES